MFQRCPEYYKESGLKEVYDNEGTNIYINKVVDLCIYTTKCSCVKVKEKVKLSL
jgi:hypothetical protein